MKKTVIALLCSALLICPLAGCSVSPSSEQDSVAAVQESGGSDKKVADSINMTPVPVPAEGWKDDTISEVIYINGEKLGFPLRLDDFGEDFGLQTKADHFLTKGDKNTAGITYKGKNCGLITVNGKCDENTIGQLDIVSLTFSRGSELDPDAPEVFPISINGVTIGSDYSELVEKLGFAYDNNDIDPNTEDKLFSVTGTTYKHAFRFQISHSKVSSITIADLNEIV